MARIGSFSQPTFLFGAAVNVVKPLDNKIPLYDPAIENAKGLTDAQKRDAQQRADELAATLILARDLKK